MPGPIVLRHGIHKTFLSKRLGGDLSIQVAL
jgi:hypothetical protein